ncbi:hypothetical protein PVK06_023010 [Gossypium arboreum]|uniref:Uncharacterized protein n=1 Tax=Gossypium arboreum TaxID=29729 RepID=A0ABR0PA07_GOSAR|nr:hypothetical protein PVK06_023010 [Gossypium arboreum]
MGKKTTYRVARQHLELIHQVTTKPFSLVSSMKWVGSLAISVVSFTTYKKLQSLPFKAKASSCIWLASGDARLSNEAYTTEPFSLPFSQLRQASVSGLKRFMP